jgi:hypothetical protein
MCIDRVKSTRSTQTKEKKFFFLFFSETGIFSFSKR